MTATVFDIQRFSVHDGPGIRTTVFMKGCPLSCRWCHNPEGLSGTLQLQFHKEKCISCSLCGERKSLSDADRCPSGALTVCGRVTDLDSLIPELLNDRIFYGENGGVTFSGGECLLRADFVSAGSLLALAALSESDTGPERFTAGELTIQKSGGSAAARCLRSQAELILMPYVRDCFACLGV